MKQFVLAEGAERKRKAQRKHCRSVEGVAHKIGCAARKRFMRGEHYYLRQAL
jgi:hypothetical protein